MWQHFGPLWFCWMTEEILISRLKLLLVWVCVRALFILMFNWTISAAYTMYNEYVESIKKLKINAIIMCRNQINNPNPTRIVLVLHIKQGMRAGRKRWFLWKRCEWRPLEWPNSCIKSEAGGLDLQLHAYTWANSPSDWSRTTRRSCCGPCRIGRVDKT